MALNLGGFYEAWQGNQLRDAQIKENQQIQQQNAMRLLDMQNQQANQQAADKQDLWSLLQVPPPPAQSQQPPVNLMPAPPMANPVNNGPMVGPGFQPATMGGYSQLPPAPRPPMQGMPQGMTMNMAPPTPQQAPQQAQTPQPLPPYTDPSTPSLPPIEALPSQGMNMQINQPPQPQFRTPHRRLRTSCR